MVSQREVYGGREDATSRGVVERVMRPFQQFVRAETAGGVVLLLCMTIALGWANSPWSNSYFDLWERSFTVGFEGIALTKTLHHWINDGLMVVFFFLVGLEIKREMLVGELASVRRSALPIAAAVGGMIVPALIFFAFNPSGPAAAGWAIPVATDIAFALGVLALVGPGVSPAVKIFLAALAIVDDIGAVLVIAFFYTAGLSLPHLVAAAVVLAALITCNLAGVRQPLIYALLGVVLWVDVLASGIHATVAGVMLAMTIPARTKINEDEFVVRGEAALDEFESACGPEETVLSNPRQQEALHTLERAIEEVQSPLLRMEHSLNGVVAFVIMPLFAFANAGVRISAQLFTTLSWAVVLGVLLGLVVGKFVGIASASWLAIRVGIAAAPSGVSWGTLRGLSWLGGIGFTMSLFIAGLAYGSGPLLDSAKVGILCGSLVAGVVGWTLVRRGTKLDASKLASEGAQRRLGLVVVGSPDGTESDL
jgi:NhaA family Na+:H+ antiporter